MRNSLYNANERSWHVNKGSVILTTQKQKSSLNHWPLHSQERLTVLETLKYVYTCYYLVFTE